MLNDFLNINWEDFHFLRPLFLWLLVPALVAFVLGLAGIREEAKWKKIIAPHLRAFIIQKGSESIKRKMQILFFLLISIAILGLAGPTWKTVEVPGKTLETPVVILLDLSQSMMATDIQPNRLERTKFKINDLLDAKPGARIALIAFAGTAHTIVPLTSDYNIIKSRLEGLSPDIMPFAGSNIGKAFQLTDTLLNISKAPGKVILFSDDFDENVFQILQNYAANKKVDLEVFPVNTLSGGDIPLPGGKGFFRDSSGKNVRSQLNRNVLDKLSSVENIHVHQLTLDKSDVENLAQKISENLQFKEEDQKKEDEWEDMGLMLAIPFFVLVLMWFRKGWVLYSVLIMLTFSSCSPGNRFSELWFTKDFQAQKLYDKGEYEDAAELFTKPLRKGNSYYRAGNYREAIQYFTEDTTAMGAYNLGLAYFKNGDYAAAAMAFGIASEMDPEMESAKKNQELLNQLVAGTNETSMDEAQETEAKQQAQNEQNTSPEDLGGGGQEATEKDMEKERLEETVATDIRKGKEMDEVPDDFESGKQDNAQKVLMRKVDDDPALFLKRKFAHQAKTKNMKPENNEKKW